jgi:hypothetical protein
MDDTEIDTRMLATFWHKHGVNDVHPVRIDPGSWKELIPNVVQINLVVDVRNPRDRVPYLLK